MREDVQCDERKTLKVSKTHISCLVTLQPAVTVDTDQEQKRTATETQSLIQK